MRTAWMYAYAWYYFDATNFPPPVSNVVHDKIHSCLPRMYVLDKRHSVTIVNTLFIPQFFFLNYWRILKSIFKPHGGKKNNIIEAEWKTSMIQCHV